MQPIAADFMDPNMG